jgi:chaperonin GroES
VDFNKHRINLVAGTTRSNISQTAARFQFLNVFKIIPKNNKKWTLFALENCWAGPICRFEKAVLFSLVHLFLFHLNDNSKEVFMSIRPLYDRVVVKPLQAETTTKGGIVLPGTAAEKPSQGEVIVVGPGAVLDNGDIRALTVKVGDRVLFGKYSGTELKIDGEDLLVVKESDILAVIESQGSSTQEKAA